MNDSDKRARLGVRAFARRRGISPSYVCRLVAAGVLQRGGDGLIDASAADAALDAARASASPGRLAANAARRRPQATAGGDRDVSGLIDPVAADTALDWQPAAFVQREPPTTPAARLLATWEARMGSAQAAILTAAFVELRAAAGSDAGGALHRAALGALWGKLRALIDDERRRLSGEMGALIDDTAHK